MHTSKMLPRAIIALVASAALTSASPCKPAATNTTTTTTAISSVSSSTGSTAPTLPSTGSTELPDPSVNATLKYIAVGHGIQNYTCSAANTAATSIGALAVLYDITSLYPGQSDGSLSMDTFNGISANVLYTTDIPLNLINQTIGAAAQRRNVAAYAAAYPPFVAAADLTISETSTPIKFLGHHYFDAAGVPTFDLSATSDFFQGKKTGDVKAPASADAGLLSTGAVDWLQLSDKGTGTTHGVSLVYRVTTAGGNPQTCDAAGDTGSVPYTAMYWFFE